MKRIPTLQVMNRVQGPRKGPELSPGASVLRLQRLGIQAFLLSPPGQGRRPRSAAPGSCHPLLPHLVHL